MTAQQKYRSALTLVAIDVAKTWNVVLIEEPDGTLQCSAGRVAGNGLSLVLAACFLRCLVRTIRPSSL